MRYNLKLQRPNKTLSPVQFVSFEAEKRFVMSTEVVVPTSKWKAKSKGVKAGLDTSKHPEVLLLSADLREAVNTIIEAHDEIMFLKQELTVANWRERVWSSVGRRSQKKNSR